MTRRTNLEKLLDFNPPSFSKNIGAFPDIIPVFFHDTHIDESLILKNVKLLPSFFDDVSSAVDRHFPEESRSQDYHDMQYWDETAYDDTPLKTTAYEIAYIHFIGAPLGCCRIASSTLLHPDQPTLHTAFSWGIVGCIPNREQDREDYDFYVQNQGLRIIDIKTNAENFKAYSPATKKKILSLVEVQPVFAVGMFLCPSVHSLVEDIEKLADLDRFPWIANSLPQGKAPKNTGEYYKQFVPDEKTDCPCGEPFQTREHLLRDCPRYEDQRYILREVSDDIALADILGTKAGIEALALFLDMSGAFTKSGNQRAPYAAPTLTLEEQDGNWDNG